MQVVDDRTAGLRALRCYLSSVQIDPENTYDFLHRINRRRPSAIIDGLYLNRLCTWTVLQRVRAVMQLDPARGVSRSDPRRMFTGLNLEMDINTPADYREELPPGALADLENELLDSALKIARIGDAQ